MLLSGHNIPSMSWVARGGDDRYDNYLNRFNHTIAYLWELQIQLAH